MTFGYLSFEVFFSRKTEISGVLTEFLKTLPHERVFLDSFGKEFESRQLEPEAAAKEALKGIQKKGRDGCTELRLYTPTGWGEGTKTYGQVISCFQTSDQNIVRWRTSLGYYRGDEYPGIRPAISKNFCEMVAAFVPKAEPDYARAKLDDTVLFEYYNDGHRFCAPVRTEYCDDFYDFQQAALFREASGLRELKEAKRVLPRKRLLETLKAATPNIIQTKSGGIGVWRRYPQETDDTAASLDEELYPAYFLRQAVRKKGGKLHFGETEKHFAAYALAFPDHFAKNGLLSKDAAEKLKAAGDLDEVDGYAYRTLALLQEETKLALGLTGELAPGLVLPEVRKRDGGTKTGASGTEKPRSSFLGKLRGLFK